MKTMKKLSIVALVCVMCVLLGIMVSAETAVEYMVTPSASELCVSSSEQEVTLTVAIDSASTVGSVDMTVTLPDEWSITSITNSTLGFSEDNYTLSTGEISAVLTLSKPVAMMVTRISSSIVGSRLTPKIFCASG